MTEKSRGEKKLEAFRTQSRAPTVFVSYSHDSPQHKNWVLRLASDLRKHGIDAMLDAWDLKPGEDVAKFMEHLASVDRVVIVCSEEYARKAEAGAGGVGYETMIVTAEILQNRGVVKFLPVLRTNPSKKLPPFLRTRKWIDFEDDAAYHEHLEDLTRALHEAPVHPKPELGANPYAAHGTPRRDVFSDQWFTAHRSAAMPEVRRRGASMEVAFGSSSHPLHCDQRTLLNVAERSAIHTFGWPIGAVLHVDGKRPVPDPNGIVARIVHQGFSEIESFDYWSLRTNGDFYLAHNLFENSRDVTAIFFNSRMVRTAESLMYCRNLYENLGLQEGATVQFRLRHAGFTGRKLSTSNPNRMMWPQEMRAAVDEVESMVEFQHPLPDHGVVAKTRELLNPLFVLFDFFDPQESLYQDVVGSFIQGRCT